MGIFESVQWAPPDPILGLNTAFEADPRDYKVNLGVGVYKTAELQPLILHTVKKAEAALIESEWSKDYLPIDGMASFTTHIKEWVLGRTQVRATYAAQTPGATGALRVGAAFLKECGFTHVLLPHPTWDNHRRLFMHAGFEALSYPYCDSQHKTLSLEEMNTFLASHTRCVVVIQACCHNPTGLDIPQAAWPALAEAVERSGHLVFFDFSYQGFAEGLEEDAALVRWWVEHVGECALAYSCSKNFGLYAERTGALLLPCALPEAVSRVASRVKPWIRGLYSNPPCHGARVVQHILSDTVLRAQWVQEVRGMRERIIEMRSHLCAALHMRGHSALADFLALQRGMFSYTALEASQVERLIAEYGIYLPRDGRINVAGLNTANLDYVADALCNCL